MMCKFTHYALAVQQGSPLKDQFNDAYVYPTLWQYSRAPHSRISSTLRKFTCTLAVQQGSPLKDQFNDV